MKTNFIIAVLLIVLCGCKKDEPMAPQQQAVSATGSWTGIVRQDNNRTVSLEFSLTQTGTTIAGSGSAQLSGSIVKSFYDVTGLINGDTVYLSFREVLIFFDGTIAGSIMTGKTRGRDDTVTFIKK